MGYQVFRADYSSYMSENFKQEEIKAIGNFKQFSWSESLPVEQNIIITNSSTRVEDIPFEVLDKCKLMLHPNSGYDNFSHSFVSAKKFPIVIGNQIREQAVSEYIISCLFHHFAPIENQDSWQQSRRWTRPLINECRIQIIGHGHIGKKITNVLSSFNCNFSIYDPFNTELKDSTLFEKIDVLILACGLNQNNKGFINKDFFNRLSKKALIINAARGPLINEEDLYHFLESNPESFAYLDVFEEEPFVDGHMQELSNLCKTSHIAGCSDSLENKILLFEKQVLKDFLENDNFDNIYKNSILKNRIIESALI